MNQEGELLGKISLIGTENDNLPMWSIIRYCDEFCTNYNKIMIIRKICELMQQGASDNDFFVATRSEELFPGDNNGLSFSYDSDKFLMLATKNNNPEEFWRIIKDYIRPVVFYTGGSSPVKLVDFTDDSAVKITNLSYNSPPILDIQGTVNGLLDVANAGNRREMEEELHISTLIGDALVNTEKLARASQVVNDPRTPSGVKNYANNLLEELTRKQEKLNLKLDVRITRIDIRC
ncbi:hypothetical protein [Fusibacter tunisiensis]|uniref:Uncharacterized protein n=1 Tax=Fusibacter tunisiensis TaxID=1008308 RepID=A0ABS2MU39_9FIRM|nr:hypothetical protein [Fusibacter tunisiensis]MBM7562944.1 hypothetical protein [Fusibacter tunisiensis]